MINKGLILKVERILTLYPEARDSDNRLLFEVWYNQMPLNTTGIEFLEGIDKGHYYSPDSITRARRKLQEENPQLRGNKYKARQEHTKTVKKELRDIKTFTSGQEIFEGMTEQLNNLTIRQ